MIGKTNHAHLEPTFQFVKAEEEPGPEDGWKEKYEAMLKERDELLGILGDVESLILPYIL